MRRVRDIKARSQKLTPKEDRAVSLIVDDAPVLAVFDGHGGAGAADICAKRIEALAHKNVGILKNERRGWTRLFEELDQEVPKGPGTTATILVRRDKQVWCAWCGDSRAIVVSANGSVRRLTEDHRPSLARERARLRKYHAVVADDYVWKGTHGLAITRSIGDARFRTVGVVCRPDTAAFDLAPKDTIVLATDGLWDAVDEWKVGEIVSSRRERTAQECANRLVGAALASDHGDNVTVLVVN